jgi:hypothetical protein
MTVRVAEAEVPTPPSFELTVDVMLLIVPAVVPVTFTVTTHEPAPGMVPPAKTILVELAPTVAVPPQLFVNPLGLATAIPVGRTSLKPMPESALPLAFDIEKLRVVVPFSGIVAAPKALPILGGAMTIKLAEAVLPVPPSFEVMADVTLFFVPGAVPVTFTATVHAPPPDKLPALKLTVEEPASAVTTPLQEFVTPLGFATCRPGGSVSEKLTPVIDRLLGFEI